MESSGTSSSDVVEASVMAKGGFVLDTKEGVFVEVVPEGSSLAASLQGASLSSSSGLNRGPIIHYSTVHPTHDAWHDSHSGLVPEVAMVVKFIGSYFGGIVGGEALVSAINNKGDISKVGKDMTSKETLRRMGTDLAVAVAMQGLTDAASLGDVSKFTGNARIGAIAGREAIMAGTSAVIRGEKLETALRGAAFATGLGVVQMKVGDVGVSAGLSEGGLVKTAMHASVGGIFAEATGSEFKYGAIAGGVGELAAGHLAPKESEAGKRLVGTISAASVLAAGGNINDMSKASHTAESAVEYNSWGHVARAVIGTIAKKVATKSTKEVAKKATTEGVKETVKSAVKQEVKQATSSATRAAVKESTQDATKTLTKAEKRGISKEYKAEVKAKDKAREVLQGNNKDLKKPTHVYKIYEKETSVKDKIGESAGKVREDGKSLRAESQVNKKNKEAGYDKYRSKIMRVYEDKRTGRKFETKWIEKVKEQDGHSALPGNKNNR